MFWKKRKRVIDIRELQRKGLIRIPINPIKPTEMPTDADGFVELGKNSVMKNNLISTPNSRNSNPTPKSNSDFFGFMDFSNSPNSSGTLSSSTTPSEDLRKISGQLADLDNKLYKMEQRIELLEKKLDVGSASANPNNSVMGW